MAENYLKVTLVDQRGLKYSGPIKSCTLPAITGSIKIYQDHIDFSGLLGGGSIKICDPNDKILVYVLEGYGIAQVTSNELVILAGALSEEQV